jgi:hypothetical protein
MNSYGEAEKMRKKKPQRKIIEKLSLAVGNNILSINVYSYSVFSLNICGNKCSFIIICLFINLPDFYGLLHQKAISAQKSL